MWQNLSLRGRINLLLALLLALGLAVNIGRQVAEAGPRVQAEDQSVIRLAREFIEMIVADLNEAPDPDARLDQIARDLSRLRHVSIALRGSRREPADGAQGGDGYRDARAAGLVRQPGPSRADGGDRAGVDPRQARLAA